jgi:hypothetical protein
MRPPGILLCCGLAEHVMDLRSHQYRGEIDENLAGASSIRVVVWHWAPGSRFVFANRFYR